MKTGNRQEGHSIPGPREGGLGRREFLAAGACALAGLAGASRWASVLGAGLPKPGPADWPRYGYDLHNTRFNPKERIIGKENADRLKLKWKFDTNVPIETTPTVIGDTLFFGASGAYFALDSQTGQQKWKYEIPAGATRGEGPTLTRRGAEYYEGRLYFGEWLGHIRCLDAETGKLVWERNLQVNSKEERETTISSACLAFEGKIYVGTVGTKNRVVCLDAETGTIRWQYWITGEHNIGKGGSMWTSPAVDEKQKIVYVVTGSNKYPGGTDPALFTESILAFDADTGYLRWFYQAHPNDPHDLDFSCHPMIFDAEAPPLRKGSVRQCVAAGNKDGVYCWDRYSGELFWKVQLTQKYHYGGPNVDGTAVAYNKVYVVSNAATQLIGKPPMSVTAALDGYSGSIVWWTYNPEGICQGGIAVANGVLYQGFNNGRVEALDADTGKVLWDYTLPTSRRGGFAIANGTMYCSNGIPGALQEGGGPGINPRELVDKFRKASVYSLYAFTVDGK